MGQMSVPYAISVRVIKSQVISEVFFCVLLNTFRLWPRAKLGGNSEILSFGTQ